MDEPFPSVSIIIPMRNEGNHIHSCLESVVAQDYPAESMEVLVVDGGSTDHSCRVVERYVQQYANLTLLDNPQQITSSACNIGVQHAQGQIIAIVSAHTTLAPDYLRQCVVALHRSGAEGVAGVMNPIGGGYIGRANSLALSSPFGAGDSKFHYAREEGLVDTIPLPAYRREVFDKVGLFDEEMVRNEDFELNYRIRKSGGKLFLSPTIRFYYTPRSSLPALWRQYFQYGRWKVRTLQKHPASLRWRQALPPIFVSSFLGSFVLSFFWTPVRWLFLFIAGCYLLADLVASTIAANLGGWRYLPILPIVFATIHFAWGLGFLYGVTRALQSSPRD
jgi:cellulose synthase/poly-beta-1,6-N-acetylglucosamine synthase-like glycosyltransferase